jgi:hypothetical protein
LYDEEKIPIFSNSYYLVRRPLSGCWLVWISL